MDRTIKDLQVTCANCKLDTICLPRGLSQQEIDNLSAVVKTDSIAQKGGYIYRQGDEFDGIIAIKSGTAKLVTSDDQGNEHILNILLPGELIGFDGLYQNKYNCSAIALEFISYCKLSANKLDQLCSTVPGITRELFKHSSEIISESQDRIVSNKRTADEKLAMFLIDLSDRLQKRGFSALEFNLPITRQEIGDHLGITLETVSRSIQQFQTNELITVQRKFITINDIQGLRDVYSARDVG